MTLSVEELDSVSLGLLAFIKGIVSDERAAMSIHKEIFDYYHLLPEKIKIAKGRSLYIYLRGVARKICKNRLHGES